ncbi:MAG: helix-turn-helix domain-containing protein [Pseudomonadota bacterium]
MVSKRDAILTSALKLFAQQGFDGVGLREIAADAKVAQPTIHYHFDSKIILLEAVIEIGASRTTGFHKDKLAHMIASTPDTQLEDIVRILFEPYNQPDQT